MLGVNGSCQVRSTWRSKAFADDNTAGEVNLTRGGFAERNSIWSIYNRWVPTLFSPCERCIPRIGSPIRKSSIALSGKLTCNQLFDLKSVMYLAMLMG